MAKTLAVEYRPSTFGEVVGQAEIKAILQNQLNTDDIRNAYLFTGGAGTGKTTTARIFANELNRGEGAPIEIDAASNNGVDDVRSINERARTLSLDSPYKVYIIDECHMLTVQAWNAMLKLIEEPPLKTIFIFCTTDPQKIPNTILSRVQRYDFQRIAHTDVVSRLDQILNYERMQISGEADALSNDDVYGGEYMDVLDFIAKIADGGMRDAITMLDKVLAYDGSLQLDKAVSILQMVDYNTMFELTNAVVDGERGFVVRIINNIHESGADVKRFIRSYTDFIIDVNKYHITNSIAYTSIPKTYLSKLADYDEVVDGFFDGMMRMLLDLINGIKYDNNPKQMIVATLLLACVEDLA